MSRFGDAAARLAGVAGWLLGWRPATFWNATPQELDAVLRAARGEDAGGAAGGVDGADLARMMGAMPD